VNKRRKKPCEFGIATDSQRLPSLPMDMIRSHSNDLPLFHIPSTTNIPVSSHMHVNHLCLHESHYYNNIIPKLLQPSYSILSRIPPELLISILTYVANIKKDIQNCLYVSRTFHECTQKVIWKSPCFTTMKAWYHFLYIIESRLKKKKWANIASSVMDINFSVLPVMGDLEQRAKIPFLTFGCPNLTSINLYRCSWIMDDFMIQLSITCPRLKNINLSYCEQLTDISIKSIAKGCLNLHTLILRECHRLSDKSLYYLAKYMTPLQRLNLAGCTLLTDDGIIKIAASCGSSMKHLVLHKTKVSDLALWTIGNKSHTLQSIMLSHCKNISNIGIRNLIDMCQSLRKVDLIGCRGISHEIIKEMLNNGLDLRY